METDKNSETSGFARAEGGLLRQYGRDIVAAALLTLAAALSIVIAMTGEANDARRAGDAATPTHLTQN